MLSLVMRGACPSPLPALTVPASAGALPSLIRGRHSQDITKVTQGAGCVEGKGWRECPPWFLLEGGTVGDSFSLLAFDLQMFPMRVMNLHMYCFDN